MGDPVIDAGAVTEIVGTAGSGRCTLVLEHIARILATGDRYAAYVDLTGELYPPAVAALGVPLERLLLVRTADLLIALRVVEALLRGGSTRVVVLDLPADSRPIKLAIHHRLRLRARATGASLVLISRSPVVPADRRIDLSEPLSHGDPQSHLHLAGRPAVGVAR